MFYLPFFFLLMSYFVLLWASGAESWFNQELKAGATIETTGCQLICNLISSSGKQWIILFVCQYNAQNVNLRSSSNVSPGSQLMNLLLRLGYLQYQLSPVVVAVVLFSHSSGRNLATFSPGSFLASTVFILLATALASSLRLVRCPSSNMPFKKSFTISVNWAECRFGGSAHQCCPMGGLPRPAQMSEIWTHGQQGAKNGYF